jgi:peptide/nickel transport system permease protein
VRAARAKGLSESAVVLRHALRNALLPLVTLAGSILPALIGGSVVVETVFSIPGMGRYAYEGILARDLNVVLATTTLSAVLTLFGILLADLAYAVVDPRIRHA